MTWSGRGEHLAQGPECCLTQHPLCWGHPQHSCQHLHAPCCFSKQSPLQPQTSGDVLRPGKSFFCRHWQILRTAISKTRIPHVLYNPTLNYPSGLPAEPINWGPDSWLCEVCLLPQACSKPLLPSVHLSEVNRLLSNSCQQSVPRHSLLWGRGLMLIWQPVL